MFDSYVLHQGVDSRRRARLFASALGCAAATFALTAVVAAGQRLDIERVAAIDAPEFAVLDYSFKPPEQPDPPEPPERESSASAAPMFGAPERAPEPTNESESDVFDPTPPKKRGVPDVPDAPPCPPGVICSSTPVVPTTTPPVSPIIGDGGGGGGQGRKQPAPVAFEELSCQYCPDPSPDQLRKTAAGSFSRSGKNVTSFCVDAKGQTYGVKTKRSHGDPEVDKVCRDTVKRWRVHPPSVGGRKRAACSRVVFDIQFGR